MSRFFRSPNGTAIGWIVFTILALPVLAFAIGAGISDGFTLNRAAVAALDLATVGLASWLLGFGISRRSKLLIAFATIFILLISVTYAAAVSLLIGGLHLNIF
ncbi:hypothetical protein Dform_01547 [Dehalogenimonas formicexedens]|uniref:Uncharacterized protein n=1 Tax=Dehalogenimonas formicexedens TaxID=1839801 RepID=A0A1P8F8R9_9CHLR|nr:hypothetical protein Dform_01547 [Dehalogenimonas formicexedens]